MTVDAKGAVSVAATTLLSVALALLLCGLLFLPFHVNPLRAYADIARYGWTSPHGLGATLVKATPLIFCALATVICWRSGFLYLGFDGCYLAGATGTTLAGLWLPAGPPAQLAAVAAAFAAGAAWAGLVGLIRTRLGGNEVLSSLMLNYVAAFIVQYLVSGPIASGNDLPQSDAVPRVDWLPVLPGTHAHLGILVAIAAAGLVAVLMGRTPLGFSWRMTGLNDRAARAAGTPVERHILVAAALGGGLAGLAGLSDVLGLQHRLIDGMGSGIGFTGMVVALLARLSALACVPAAILYAGLITGAEALQRDMQLPASVVDILESLIILFILAGSSMSFLSGSFLSRSFLSGTRLSRLPGLWRNRSS